MYRCSETEFFDRTQFRGWQVRRMPNHVAVPTRYAVIVGEAGELVELQPQTESPRVLVRGVFDRTGSAGAQMSFGNVHLSCNLLEQQLVIGTFDAVRASYKAFPVDTTDSFWYRDRDSAREALWTMAVRTLSKRIINRPSTGVLAAPEAFDR